MPETSVPPFMPLVPFKLLPPFWSSVGVSLSRWVRVWVLLRETAWGFSSFFHQLNPHWFLQPEVLGTYLPGPEPWPGVLVSGWDYLFPRYPSQTFICHTWVRYHPPVFSVCAPPTSLDGCGLTLVVRLPFNSISDSSEWWLFYTLVVVLMLCEEASHVYDATILTGSWFSNF